MSVDARTKGRKLDSYRRTSTDLDDVTVLVDPDLLRLPVDVTVTAAGVFRRGLSADVDGIDGAPCPIQLVR